jgi:hypothetical protein
MLVDEFGLWRNIGPSVTNRTTGEIIQACEARGFDRFARAWDDPASDADDTWFALLKNGDDGASTDLTPSVRRSSKTRPAGSSLAHPATTF